MPEVITLQTPMMMPGCGNLSCTNLSWPMTCMFLVRVCMSNFSMRDLQTGLTEEAKTAVGFTETRGETKGVDGCQLPLPLWADAG